MSTETKKPKLLEVLCPLKPHHFIQCLMSTETYVHWNNTNSFKVLCLLKQHQFINISLTVLTVHPARCFLVHPIFPWNLLILPLQHVSTCYLTYYFVCLRIRFIFDSNTINLYLFICLWFQYFKTMGLFQRKGNKYILFINIFIETLIFAFIYALLKCMILSVLIESFNFLNAVTLHN